MLALLLSFFEVPLFEELLQPANTSAKLATTTKIAANYLLFLMSIITSYVEIIT